MGRGKLPNNRRKKCENNGRPLLVSLIYWCRSAMKSMNPVVLSGGYMLILIYSICATERWSSIVGCSKKYAAWIWSIRLSSFVFCVTVLFGPGKKKQSFSVWKIYVKSRASNWGPGLRSGFDRVMWFQLYHWQILVIWNIYWCTFFSFLAQAAHIEKRKEKQSTDLWPAAFVSKLWRNRSWNCP